MLSGLATRLLLCFRISTRIFPEIQGTCALSLFNERNGYNGITWRIDYSGSISEYYRTQQNILLRFLQRNTLRQYLRCWKLTIVLVLCINITTSLGNMTGMYLIRLSYIKHNINIWSNLPLSHILDGICENPSIRSNSKQLCKRRHC